MGIDYSVDIDYSPTSDELRLLEQVDNIEIVDRIEEEGLRYIAGYAASRFRDKYPFLQSTELLSNPKNDWITFLSKGKLISPSNTLFELAKTMNYIFEKYHGSFIHKGSWIFTNVANQIIAQHNLEVPKEVLLCLIRTRTYIRIREINKLLSANAYRRKKDKKMRKFGVKNSCT